LYKAVPVKKQTEVEKLKHSWQTGNEHRQTQAKITLKINLIIFFKTIKKKLQECSPHPFAQKTTPAESADVKVPRTDKALPLWTAMSIRCCRKHSDRGSREASSTLRPKALTNSMAPGPHTPKVNGDRNEYV